MPTPDFDPNELDDELDWGDEEWGADDMGDCPDDSEDDCRDDSDDEEDDCPSANSSATIECEANDDGKLLCHLNEKEIFFAIQKSYAKATSLIEAGQISELGIYTVKVQTNEGIVKVRLWVVPKV